MEIEKYFQKYFEFFFQIRDFFSKKMKNPQNFKIFKILEIDVRSIQKTMQKRIKVRKRALKRSPSSLEP